MGTPNRSFSLAVLLWVGLAACSIEQPVEQDKPPVEVANAWLREPPPGNRPLAGYLTLHNHAQQSYTLVAASSPAFERLEFHTMRMAGGMMQMRQVAHYDVPAAGQLSLQPGGDHLMAFGLRQPVKGGQTLPLQLRLQAADGVELTVDAQLTIKALVRP